MSFAPQLSALPEAQRALWPKLKPLSSRFVLYGGTALALRYGHRVSEDFDLFCDAPMSANDLLESTPLLTGAIVRQKAPNTLTVPLRAPAPVKISFFGGSASNLYGEQFFPAITLKALTYFRDGDLPSLPEATKELLRAATVIEQIPQIEPLPGGLVPADT